MKVPKTREAREYKILKIDRPPFQSSQQQSLPFLTMAPKKVSSSASTNKPKSKSSTPKASITPLLLILGLLTALLAGTIYVLDQNLELFYIFTPEQLKDVSGRAIAQHGNDTAAVVQYIVGELSEKHPGGAVNLDEEWIFNNAGGAMVGGFHPLKWFTALVVSL